MSLSLTPSTYRGSLGQLLKGTDGKVIQQRGIGGSGLPCNRQQWTSENAAEGGGEGKEEYR